MTPTIRHATADDLPALLEIERQSFASPRWSGKAFLRYTCMVAEIDGQIAGFLVSRETFSGDQEEPAEREILNLAVAPPYRRTGIATALLENELRKPGNHFLEVRESNSAAQALYRKLGFVQIGSRPEYYEKPRESAIVMQMKWC